MRATNEREKKRDSPILDIFVAVTIEAESRRGRLEYFIEREICQGTAGATA